MASASDPSASRRALIERLELSFDRLARNQEMLGTPATAVKKLQTLQALIQAVKARGEAEPAAAPPAAAPPAAASPPDDTPTWRDLPRAPEAVPAPPALALSVEEVEALLAFYEDAIDAIQLARYSVRFQRPLTSEPSYPRGQKTILAALRRALEELRSRSG